MKKNNYIIWFYIVALYLVFSAFIAYQSNLANQYRIRLASNLYNLAKDQENPNKRILSLIQSNTLSPSDYKKIDLARIYYRSGHKNIATQILSSIDCQSERLACDYLNEIGEFKIANEKSKELPDSIRDEYDIYNQVATNNNIDAIKDLSVSPITNPALLIKHINQKNYSALSMLDLINDKTVDRDIPNLNDNSVALNLASTFNIMEIPGLALFTLGNIKDEIIPEKIIRADALIILGNNEEAYELILSTIKKDPSNLSLYEKAFEIAKTLKPAKDLDLLKQNYQALIKLSS